MKFSRRDRLPLILAVAVLLALAATLNFGTGRSRHGYGSLPRPAFPGQWVSARPDTPSLPTHKCRHPDCRLPHNRAAPES